MITTRRKIVVYENAFIELRDDEVTFTDGSPGRYVSLAPKPNTAPGAVVLPVREGRICLVRTYRYPLGATQWGLPRGFGQDPDPLVTARNELREETGIERVSFELLGHVCPDSGLMATRAAVVGARVEQAELAALDRNEVADVEWRPLDDLRRDIAAGAIDDGYTLAGLAIAVASGWLAPQG